MKWTRIWESVTSKVKEKIGEGGERFLLMILIGILFLIIGIPRRGEKGQLADNRYSAQSEEIPSTEDENAYGDGSDYAQLLEKELESALSFMDGVGEVKVMITLKDCGEHVVEKDVQKNRKEIYGTSDTAGRSGEEMKKEDTVFTGERAGQAPFVKKNINPQVEGVIVIAEGASDRNVRREIAEAVQVLFDLDITGVKVLKMGHIRSR